MFVIATGVFPDGLSLLGPFATKTDAERHCEARPHYRQIEYEIVEIETWDEAEAESGYIATKGGDD
jgi:hypothetical protein